MLKHFFLLFSILILRIFTHADYSNLFIKEVCKYANTAIMKVDEDRIYFDPSRLFVEDEGIFLISDSSKAILLPYLFFSSNGVYIKSSEKIVAWWMCTVCGRYYKFEPPPFCDKCGNTTFVRHYFDET